VQDIMNAYPREDGEDDAAWARRALKLQQERDLAKSAAQKTQVTYGQQQTDKGNKYVSESIAQAAITGDYSKVASAVKNLSLRNGNRAEALADASRIAREAGVEIDPNRVERAIATMQDAYQPNGNIYKQLTSYGTSIRHLAGLNAAIDRLQRTNSPLLNIPMNKWAQFVEGSPEYAAAQAALGAPLKEIQSLLLSNRALYQDDREEASAAANLNMSPAALKAVINEWASIATVRLGEQNTRYKVDVGQDIEGIASQQVVDAAASFGMDQKTLFKTLGVGVGEGRTSSQGGNIAPGQQPSGQYPPNRKIRVNGKVVNTDANGNIIQ
jgi:hypothetical protein